VAAREDMLALRHYLMKVKKPPILADNFLPACC
jgi:hypothetical protein